VKVLFSYRAFSGRRSPDGVEHFGAGIAFTEVSRATSSFGVCARFWIVVSSDEYDRSVPAFCYQPPGEFDTGHATELDVEQQAVELRMLRIREKCLC
jgi:hypothetical protein